VRAHHQLNKLNDDHITLATGIQCSPKFREMVAEAVEGKLGLRDIATVSFLAGRLSIALAAQR
jgi:hypothetical protein